MIGRSAMHCARVVVGIDQLQTQTSREERDMPSSVLPGAKRVVQIGVFEGFTTRMRAEWADGDAVIYGIDPCCDLIPREQGFEFVKQQDLLSILKNR